MMESILATNESYGETAPVESDIAIAMSEGAALQGEVTAISLEYERVSDICSSLENLAMVAGSVTEASNAEVGLAIVAGEMALAGTNLALDVVNPSVETRSGGTISVEGFTDMAKKLWAGIKKMLVKMRDAISGFFKKYFGTTVRLRRAAQSMLDRAEKTASKVIEEQKTELGSECNLLRIDPSNKKVLEADKVIEGIEVLRGTLTELFDYYTGEMLKVGDLIADGISAYDMSKPSALATFLRPQLSNRNNPIFPQGSHSAMPKKDKRYKTGDVGSRLIGLSTLAFLAGSTRIGPAGTPLSNAEILRRTRIVVRPSGYDNSTRTPVEEATVTTYATSQVVDICEEIISICDLLDGYDKSSTRKDIDKVEIRIKKESDSLDKRFQKEDEMKSSAKADVRAVLNFNKSFTMWVSEPHMPLVALAIAVSRAALTASSKSLSNYA